MDLADIFAKQLELNQRINPQFTQDIQDPELRKKLFFQFELAMRQESAEAIDSLSWKWWKKMDDNWDNVKIELVDILHFWVSMCMAAGMTAQDVVELYFKKNELNHQRQAQGYKEGTYNKYQDGIEDNAKLTASMEKKG